MATKTKKASAKPAVTKLDVASLTAIDKFRASSTFNRATAIDVDFTTGNVSIAYQSAMNGWVSTSLKNPSEEAFAKALMDLITNSHEASKNHLKANAAALILKVISLDKVRVDSKTALAQSNKDKKIAKEIYNDFIAKAEARAAKIKTLEAELTELKG